MNLFKHKDGINREAIESFGRAGLAAPKLLAKAGRSAKGLRPSAVNNKKFNI
jgi:hypothetical protein